MVKPDGRLPDMDGMGSALSDGRMTASRDRCRRRYARPSIAGRLLVVVVLAGCGGSSRPGGGASAVQGVVASYVEAGDQHDGSTLCGLFDRSVAAHFNFMAAGGLTCSRFVGAVIRHVRA